MQSDLQSQLLELEKSGTHRYLKGAMHGIEKEGLRVDATGALSLTPHPHLLGSPLTNSDITTDFSESLLELITPAFSEAETAISFLNAAHQFTYSHLGQEYIWAGSMPCHIEDASLIPLAEFGSSNAGKMKHFYRMGLKHRYGSMMQSIAGIHYNFSLPETFWESLQSQKKNTDNLQSFRSASYFKMIRNFRRHSWLLLYLFGASPALSKSFMSGKNHDLEIFNNDTLFLPYATSLRMSDLGYSTDAQASLKICFNHLDTYTKSLTEAIHTAYPAYEKIGVKVDGNYHQLAATILQIENEYYSDIRPKRIAKKDETPLQALGKRGVEYIEVRNTDINPFLPVGIDLQQALFFDVFLISCLLMSEETLSPLECKQLQHNLQKVTTNGRQPGLKLTTLKGEIDIKDAGAELNNAFAHTATLLDQLHKTDSYSLSVDAQTLKVQDSTLTPSAMCLESMRESEAGYDEWMFKKSKEHKAFFAQKEVNRSTFKTFEQQVEESIIKQKQIEDSDIINFDEYLKLYRTGKS
jgi:glutamate--cysteine ligase